MAADGILNCLRSILSFIIQRSEAGKLCFIAIISSVKKEPNESEIQTRSMTRLETKIDLFAGTRKLKKYPDLLSELAAGSICRHFFFKLVSVALLDNYSLWIL